MKFLIEAFKNAKIKDPKNDEQDEFNNGIDKCISIIAINTIPVPGEVSGVELITLERFRQLEGEGYDEAHDDEHVNDELAKAGATYGLPPSVKTRQMNWPFDGEEFKPSENDRIPELVKGAALYAAEIDRLKRAE